MDEHLMNPFHFVPLPADGPKELPAEILNEPRFEGYLEFTLETITPLHITGKTTKVGSHFAKKDFYRANGKRVIPGKSIRGMLSSFIEALTGSDLRVITRGDEKDRSGRPVYGKWFLSRSGEDAPRNRHVGFLVASADDRDFDNARKDTYNVGGSRKVRYERGATLPNGFGRHAVEDAATFLFGHVPDRKGSGLESRAGRLFFEDIVVPAGIPNDVPPKKAWDLDSDSVMGSPNPRANTAWYFQPASSPRRRVAYGGHPVWEFLADKVRGRKFYFHQRPEDCHEKYGRWEWLRRLREYDLETIPLDQKIPGGRMSFIDLPESILKLLVYSLLLGGDMAHKLGALKPFGFGSVKFIDVDIRCRNTTDPFDPIKSTALSLDRSFHCLLDMKAYSVLEKIMHFSTDSERDSFVFVYPPYNTSGINPEAKGFAQVEEALDPRLPPTRDQCKKITMFFDQYQSTASNYKAVMGR